MHKKSPDAGGPREIKGHPVRRFFYFWTLSARPSIVAPEETSMDRAARIAYFRSRGREIEVLLVLQSGRTHGPHGMPKSRVWKLPGGTCAAGESFEETALRKFKEKAGFDLPVEHRHFAHFVYHVGPRYAERVYLAIDRQPPDPAFEPAFHSEEVESVRWFPVKGLARFRDASGAKQVPLGGPYRRYIQQMQRKYAYLIEA